MNGRGDAIVTSLREPISTDDERRFKSAIIDHLRHGRIVHVIDVSEVKAVSARLMHTLLALFYATRREGGVFAVVATQPSVLELFSITGIDGIVPIFSDVARAVLAAEACGRNPNECLRARAAAIA